MSTSVPAHYVDAYKRKEMTLGEIAAQMGKAPSTVYKALQRAGVDTSAHRKRKADRNVELIEAVKKLKNLELVAGQYKLTRERVRQIVQRAILDDAAKGVSLETLQEKYGYDRERVQAILRKSEKEAGGVKT